MAKRNRALARLIEYTASGKPCEVTIGAWARYHGIHRRTATRDLVALEGAGLVDAHRIEANNNFGYEWVLVVYPPKKLEGME